MSNLFLLLFAKISLSAGMVITITLVAEGIKYSFCRSITGVSAWDQALPFYFTGIEQGPLFAAESAPWSIQGLSATLVFCLLYSQSSTRVRGKFSIFAAHTNHLRSVWLFCDCLFFAICAAGSTLASYRDRHLGLCRRVTVFFRLTPSPAIRHKVPTTALILVSRALFAAVVIVVITAMAKTVGSRWSGIFAAFPTTVLPTVWVLHYHYGHQNNRSTFSGNSPRVCWQ